MRLQEHVKAHPKSNDSEDSFGKIWIESREVPSSIPHDVAEPKPSAVSDGPTRTKKGLAKWILFFIWLSTLMYLTPLLALWGTGLVTPWGPRLVTGNPLFSSSFSGESACQPGGNFNPFPDTYTAWTSAGFFQISMAFGSLSFTEAKVVDVVWDLVSNSYALVLVRSNTGEADTLLKSPAGRANRPRDYRSNLVARSCLLHRHIHRRVRARHLRHVLGRISAPRGVICRDLPPVYRRELLPSAQAQSGYRLYCPISRPGHRLSHLRERHDGLRGKNGGVRQGLARRGRELYQVQRV